MTTFEQLEPCIIWERVDEARLDWLLAHERYVNSVDKTIKAKLEAKLRHELTPYDQARIKGSLYKDLKDYKAKPLVRDARGIVARSVRYAYSHKASEGRLYARGPSLQSFKSTVREFLTAGVLRDWDAENCHPRIILWLCEQHNVKVPRLEEYVRDRDAVRDGLPGTRKEAKTMIISVMYGSKQFVRVDPWLDLFGKEMKHIVDALVATPGSPGHRFYLAATRIKATNPKFSALSKFVGTVESCMLNAMSKQATASGVTVRSLAFDGLMTDADVPDDFAAALQVAVTNALTITLPIVEKPIPDVMPELPGTAPADPDQDDPAPAVVRRRDDPAPAVVRDDSPDQDDSPDPDQDSDDEDDPVPVRRPRPDDDVPDDFPDSDDEDDFEPDWEAWRAEDAAFVEPDWLEDAEAGAGGGAARAFHALYYTTEPEGDVVAEEDVRLDDDILCENESGIIALQARMGTGKTYQMVRVVKFLTAKGCSVVLVVQRINMAFTLIAALAAQGIPTRLYSDIRKRIEPECGTLIIEYESLWRLNPGRFDLVVCDEFRSILATTQSSTNGNRRLTNYARFEALMVEGEKVLCTDADMHTDALVRYTLDEYATKKRDMLALMCTQMASAASKQGDMAERDRWLTVHRDNLEPKPVKYLNPDTTRILREVTFVSRAVAIWRMRADALRGWRFGVACGSRRQAEAISNMLKPYATGTVGLYTMLSDNKEDLRELANAWDPHQIIIFSPVMTTGADYQTFVHRVYAIPTTNCYVPREVLQQAGRFRKVHTNQIWITTAVENEEDLEQCDTSAGTVEQVAKDEGVRVRKAGDLVASMVKQTESFVRLTVGPGTVGVFRRATDIMVACASYTRAEQSFVHSDLTFTAMLYHMCEEKGYPITWGTDLPDGIDEVLTSIAAEWKEAIKQVSSDDDSIMAGLVVQELAANPDAMATLSSLAVGRKLRPTERDVFLKEYGAGLGEMTRKEFTLAYEKATMARLFPGQGDQAVMEAVALMRKHKDIVGRIELLSNPDKVTMAAAFLKDVKTREGMELGDHVPYIEVKCLQPALESIGVTSLFSQQPVQVTDIAKVKAVLDNLRALRLAPSGDGSKPFKQMQRALKKLLGVEAVQGKPLKFIKGVQAFLDRQPQWPSARQWYMEEYGVAAPAQDGFKPTRDMTSKQLRDLSHNLRNAADFADVKRKADRIRAERAGDKKAILRIDAQETRKLAEFFDKEN